MGGDNVLQSTTQISGSATHASQPAGLPTRRPARPGRPQRIREVFAELQMAVGDLAPASELLVAAADMVALHDTADAMAPAYLNRAGDLPFDQWAVDRVFAHDTWRVVANEPEFVRPLYADDLDAVSEQREFTELMSRLAA